MRTRLEANWSSNEDRNKINLSLVPTVIIGAKFEIFANSNESLKKKLLCNALRYIAHTYGCDLVFGSIKEKQPQLLYRSMLNKHVFGDISGLSKIEKNHNLPINLHASSDRYADIGEPDGANMRSKSFEQIW